MERLLTLLGAEHVEQKAQEILQLEQHLANVRGMCAMIFGVPLDIPVTDFWGCLYLLLNNLIPILPWAIPLPAPGNLHTWNLGISASRGSYGRAQDPVPHPENTQSQPLGQPLRPQSTPCEATLGPCRLHI